MLFKKKLKFVFVPFLLFSVLISSSNINGRNLNDHDALRDEESINLVVKEMYDDYNSVSNNISSNEFNDVDKESFIQYISFENGKAFISENFLSDTKDLYMQCDNEDYIKNLSDEEKQDLIKAKFLEDNINLMNSMVDKGLGFINENGDFIVYEDDEYQQQEAMVYDYSWSIWTNMKFKTSASLAGIFGIAGLILNCYTLFQDMSNLASCYKNNKSLFKGKIADAFNKNAAVKSAAFDVCNEVVGNLNFDEALSILVSTVMSVMAIFIVIIQASGLVGLVVNLVLTILSIYLPGLITSLDLIIKGAFNNIGASVNIGWWWSNYSLLR